MRSGDALKKLCMRISIRACSKQFNDIFESAKRLACKSPSALVRNC